MLILLCLVPNATCVSFHYGLPLWFFNVYFLSVKHCIKKIYMSRTGYADVLLGLSVYRHNLEVCMLHKIFLS
jgi:hypothetical protein